MRKTSRMGQRRRWLPLLLVLLLVTTACSGMSGDSSAGADDGFQEIGAGLGGEAGDDGSAPGQGRTTATTAAAAGDEAQAPEDEDSTGTGDALGDDGITAQVTLPADIGRDIIFTAEMTVATNDVAAASREATRIIQSLGGFLFGQRTTGSPEPRSVLTFKVHPEDFQEALDRLGAIGELRTQNVSADDVTERIVDLQSRINTAEASVGRLRGFLAEAESIEVIAELENQLLQRETQLETLRGQLRTLQDQVALATIVLTVTQTSARPALGVTVTAYPGHDGEGLSCPGSPSLTVEQGSPATICYEITNTGDTLLADLDLRDPVLDVERDDFIVVLGDLTTPLEPGQSVLVALEVTPERDLRTQTTITVLPVDEEGEPVAEREIARTVAFTIEAVDPGGIPTFTEGLEASWELLIGFGQVLMLVAAWLLPFLWVPLLGFVLWRVLRPRREALAPEQTPAATQPEREREPVSAVEKES